MWFMLGRMWVVYVGKDVGGDQFSLTVVPANRVDAV
jgi:hypothetical protein